jgi:hypothetical protein
MIKLLAWNDFVQKVDVRYGLCNNLVRVYPTRIDIRFMDFLIDMGLHITYPIGVGGYLKYNGKVGMPWHGRVKHDRNKVFYRDCFNLYTGVQEALRHNLYIKFCHWLVKNYPSDYSLSSKF